MKTFSLFFLAVFFAALPVHADVVWALAGPTTGSIASWGLSQQAGIKQAVDDINAAGGVNKQKIILKTYDDACDPKQAVAVANKIISEGIHFSLHGTCSAASMAYSKVYLEEGVVVINAMASNPKVTDDGGPTLFRAMYRDDDAALVMADEIKKHFAQKKLVILNDKSAYGLGVAQYVRDRLNKAGIKEILFDSYDPDNHDYSVLVTKLKELRAEVLFVGGYPIEAGAITRQVREAGLKTQIMAGDLSTPDYWKIASASGEGALFAFPTDPRKAPAAQNVVAKLQKAGVVIDGYTLYGYAATQALAEAIAKTGNTDPAKVAATLHKEKFDTILGTWSFNEKGDVRDIHLVLYHWHNGQFSEVSE